MLSGTNSNNTINLSIYYMSGIMVNILHMKFQVPRSILYSPLHRTSHTSVHNSPTIPPNWTINHFVDRKCNICLFLNISIQ